MTKTQKQVFFALISIGALYFILFIFPNATGAKDRMMISLFEPDEFAQYPIAIKMIRPEATLKAHLINFIVYGHYYYGWPFYALSALTLLPIVFTQGYDHVQLNLLALRQMVGVLPMLAALLLLVYTQTKFKSHLKSLGLFIFLLSVSAVVENNLWWHVDSLAFLFVVLTLYFLDRDNLHFGRDFYFAAAATGLAVGTKVIGLFFCLAIPTYLLMGMASKRLTVWKAAQLGATFTLLMAATIVIVNPFMLLKSQFNDMLEILARQSHFQTKGWVLYYASGPAAWAPILKKLYGQIPFILLALVSLGLGIWKRESRLRHILIALWSIPFGLYVLFAVAIKPTHFFLPILLPIYSSLIVLFDFAPFKKTYKSPLLWLWGGAVVAILIYQFGVYLQQDFNLYHETLTREEHEGSLAFYAVLEKEYLPKIKTDRELVAFRDVRMYLPDDSRWVVKSYWNSKYSAIESIRPDLIIIWSQRILDYTQAGAQENAVDPATFQDTYQFFVDANHDQLRGYRLVYRDAEGLFFVSDPLYAEFFAP
ncbi:MAG: hypothetical protein IT310_07660 [Anaerolineales bacterium]|nr:hypothetical protein [Anaerolineales bacterium]